MGTDLETAAEQVVGNIPDVRAKHFWDPEKSAGKAIGKSVGYEGRVAWDFYAFYPPGAEWLNEPPQPSAWVYQPSDDWTEPEHAREDEPLVQALVDGVHKVCQDGQTK